MTMAMTGQEKQRFFKGLALILAGLIFVGMVLVIYGMVKRAGELGGRTLMPPKIGEAQIGLPTGARVLSTALDGGRILLRVGLQGGGERLYVIDTETGKLLSTLDIVEGG
ncbi:MAG: hypothetical protein R3E60_06690 [Alphaproteobacteria bacterium]